MKMPFNECEIEKLKSFHRHRMNSAWLSEKNSVKHNIDWVASDKRIKSKSIPPPLKEFSFEIIFSVECFVILSSTWHDTIYTDCIATAYTFKPQNATEQICVKMCTIHPCVTPFSNES